MDKRTDRNNDSDDYSGYTFNYVNMEYNYNDNNDDDDSNYNRVGESANNNSVGGSVERSTFNLRKAVELRQARLQQRQLQQQQQKHQQQSTQSNIANADVNPSHSLKRHYAHSTRRRRLQRQPPTEVDDMDFAYAADLEEEAEDDFDEDDNDNEKDNDATDVPPRNIDMLSTDVKRLPHFPLPLQQVHGLISSTTDFTGQPSSLPSCYTATTTAYHHLQQHQHYHHQRQQQQHRRERRLKHEESFDSSTTTTTTTTETANSPTSPSLRRHNFAMLKRDNSTQSESSSRYSSVDSLLEARKPDPEAILINLGFGPIGSEDILSRIPKRFLKPSQVRGIDTEAFIRRLQLANNLADHSALGYRGLTGNPDLPPSSIVAKIMQRFEVNERKKSMGSIEHTI